MLLLFQDTYFMFTKFVPAYMRKLWIKKYAGQEVAIFRQNSDTELQISDRGDYGCSDFNLGLKFLQNGWKGFSSKFRCKIYLRVLA